MPVYVYGCSIHQQHREEVIHSMQDNPIVLCPDCQSQMHRIPQAFRWYHNPGAMLIDKLTTRFTDYRKEKKYGIKRPKYSPL